MQYLIVMFLLISATVKLVRIVLVVQVKDMLKVFVNAINFQLISFTGERISRYFLAPPNKIGTGFLHGRRENSPLLLRPARLVSFERGTILTIFRTQRWSSFILIRFTSSF